MSIIGTREEPITNPVRWRTGFPNSGGLSASISFPPLSLYTPFFGLALIFAWPKHQNLPRNPTEMLATQAKYRLLPDDSTNSSPDMMEEDTILVSYSTREAWNDYFYMLHCLAFALALQVHTFETKRQTHIHKQGNGNFSVSCIGASACVGICVEVVHTCVYLSLRFHLRLRRSCEPLYLNLCPYLFRWR